MADITLDPVWILPPMAIRLPANFLASLGLSFPIHKMENMIALLCRAMVIHQAMKCKVLGMICAWEMSHITIIIIIIIIYFMNTSKVLSQCSVQGDLSMGKLLEGLGRLLRGRGRGDTPLFSSLIPLGGCPRLPLLLGGEMSSR